MVDSARAVLPGSWNRSSSLRAAVLRRAAPSHRLARATAACSIGLAALLIACVPAKAPAAPELLVNPFIGTQDYGNTFPGAALPFGMVPTRAPSTKTTAPPTLPVSSKAPACARSSALTR